MTMDCVGLNSTQEAPISGIVVWLWETYAIGNDESIRHCFSIELEQWVVLVKWTH